MAIQKKSLSGAAKAKPKQTGNSRDVAAKDADSAKLVEARKLAVAKVATAKLTTARLTMLKNSGG